MCAKPVRQMCAKPAENRPSDSSRGNGKDPRPHGVQPRRGPFGFPVRPLGYRFACPFVTRLLARLPVLLLAPRLPLGRLASATPWLPLGVRLCPSARLPLAPSPRTAAPACRSPQAKGGPPHGTARPSALDIPLCARPFATRFAWPPARPSATALLAPLPPVYLPVCLSFCSPLGYPSGAWPRPPLGYPSACAFARPLGYPSPHRRGPPRPRADHPKRKADRPTERPAPRRSISPYALGPP